jgi:DNA-binding response OmpR family regulator
MTNIDTAAETDVDPDWGFSGDPGVLVVDDEDVVRTLLRLGLMLSGFDVLLAPDGRDAVRLYREHGRRIAVALIDVRMPGLDGPATLAALRELNPDLLACFMSGDGGKYSRDELCRRGAAYVIDKPFRLAELAGALRALLPGVAEPTQSPRVGGPGVIGR